MNKYISPIEWQPSEGVVLTKVSKKIVTETNKSLSILAGPGAGKTEILAQRANFLLQTGACKFPQKILALSFKVDAAANIGKRVEMRCEKALSRRFDSSTFDAFFISLVRRFHPLLPQWIKIPPDFDVYPFDRDWWLEYEQAVLNRQPCKYKSTFDLPDLHSPLDLTQRPDVEIVKIWNYCAENKVADYNMCRSMAFSIIKQHEQVRSLILSTYKYLFLDEFQDASDHQYLFVKTIFKDRDTIITAVGDSNQMIMGWAGANPKNFDTIKKDFHAELVTLAINHRSNSKIISLINHVIKDLTPTGENPVTYEGTRKDPPPKLSLGAQKFNSVQEEAAYIAAYINILLKKNSYLKPGDFCLILRQKAQEYFEGVEENFRAASLGLRNEDALVVKNGIKIQDLMAEPLSILWVLLVRKALGLIDYEKEKELERIVISLTGHDPDQDRSYRKLQQYINTLLAEIDFSVSVEQWTTAILKAIGNEKLKNVYPQYRSQYLGKVKKSFCLLFEDCLKKNPKNKALAIERYEGTSQVKLMTIHKSKGLEFDTVFFVDFHDKSWWGLGRAIQQKNARAQVEEKNAFFVGLSRAKERLYFTKGQNSWPPVITDLLKESKLLENMPDI